MRLATSIGLILLMSATAVPAQEAEVRTWTDVTGKHKMQARFVSLDGTTVTLKQADGTEFEIELEQLNPADRKVIEDEVAKAPVHSRPNRRAPSCPR